MPDYVQEVLDFIDTNWKTSNYSPKPILIDKRDGTWQNESRRTTSVDLTTEGNSVVMVGGGPGTDHEPEGIQWSHDRVEAGVGVRVEGLHEDEHGDITDSADFGSLVDEVERTLQVERRRPIDDYFSLIIRRTDRFSGNNTDYFRSDLSVFFDGLETLP